MIKIGIDLDETIIDLINPLLAFYKNKTGKRIKKEELAVHNFWEVLGESQETIDELEREFYESETFDNLRAFPYAKESLYELRKNAEIFIVTARYNMAREKTPKWLEKNLRSLVTGVFFTSDYLGTGPTKKEVCEQHSLEFFIEDAAKIALQCASTNTKVLLFNQPWNQNISHQNIRRVYSWQEVPYAVDNLKNPSSFLF